MAETTRKIAEGDIAPDFTTTDQSGTEHSLADYRGRQVVLFFYPKDMTPGCTIEACDFRDNHQRIVDAGGVVFGVSADSAASHRKFVAKHDLPYPLLVDDDHEICEAYGAWVGKKMFGKEFKGVQRRTVVIDGDGTIRKIFPKVKVEGHVDEVLDVLSS